MKLSAVKEAIQEAERFIKAAKKVKETDWKDGFGIVRKFDPYGANAAACKRASMDLTRSLSKMRQS